MSSGSGSDREYLSLTDSSDLEFTMSHLSPEQIVAKEQELLSWEAELKKKADKIRSDRKDLADMEESARQQIDLDRSAIQDQQKDLQARKDKFESSRTIHMLSITALLSREFSGMQISNNEAELHFRKFLKFLEIHSDRFTTVDEQVDASEYSLAGTAHRWFGLNREPHWSVDDLKKAFMKRFGKSESRQQLRNEFKALHYSSGSDIPGFSHRIGLYK